MQNSPQSFRPNLAIALVGFAVLFGLALAGVRALQPTDSRQSQPAEPVPEQEFTGAAVGLLPALPTSGPVLTPTPDPPHALPRVRTQVEQYTVQAGDTLASVAQRYTVSIPQILQANGLSDPNYVEVGQVLSIPLPDPANSGPGYKIIPDSELVYSPSNAGFDTAGTIAAFNGYLANYKEEVVPGLTMSGTEIVQRIATEYSVNPRLLLALLEHQSGWLTQSSPKENTLEYPLRYRSTSWKGLWRQLSWAANELNRGYYLWRVGGTGAWLLADNQVVPINPTINAGTAGVQRFFAPLSDQATWLEAVSPGGFDETFTALFGYPFGYAYEPLLPPDLAQPEMLLPIEAGDPWSFTGGPHGGWADGSAWAALDFAPPGDAYGCVDSAAWVTAVADGVVVRSGDGAVLQDLDGDGLEQTGWVVLYMHVATADRAPVGARLKAGDRVGHPSCEGGVSNGTHLHLARKYNGEWISADQSIPFVLDGWVSSGTGNEYDGYLTRDGQSVEAYAGRSDINQIAR